MTDDNAMMLEVKAGNLDYLTILFNNYHIKLFNYFIRMGNTKAASEDLVQETFIRVLNYRASYRGEHQFVSWLYRVAKNTAIDFYRKHPAQNQTAEFQEEIHSDAGTLTDELSSKQQQDNFQLALQRLSGEHREIIVLSRFQQLKYDEIAELMECNLNTLKTRVRAALKALKEEYDLISGVSL